ncbi:DUF1631 domain-containing protein [Pseudomonas capeferrum]|uniref:DUF1631 domain-containing protein n=1 Tax=Pseudomonas capeferrum TaxID=1495066 RepID=UPI0015E2D394|nr:DUF1631 domain-containing protein [Pseudomonas capeferrum]MBA1201919.1 DUF1631 domain-containing protein [Pseudomonas capeferrum]
MFNEGKVVPLAGRLDASLPGLPVMFLQVRDKAALQLRQGLRALFDNADDTLFEMSDKATGSHEQNLLFEAMRALRLKRKHIESSFLDSFYESFARIGQTDTRPHAATRTVDSVRDQDHLERAIAVESMVDRTLSRHGFPFQQLNLRFEALLDRPLDEQRNPLGPASLCGYFLQAAERDLGVSLKVKLILLKLFERYVLRDIDLLYGEANQMLIVAGVLPDLKLIPCRRADDRRRAGQRAPANQMVIDEPRKSGASQAFIDAVQPLLAPSRTGGADKASQLIGTADLLRLLSHLQQRVPSNDEAGYFDPRQQLDHLLARVSARSNTRRRVAQADADVITLVGLVFDYIRNDDNLPPALRILIARLHIPMLKVALLDKGFFSRASHPARRLLNEIAAATLGWDDAWDGHGERHADSLYLRIERVVQRLLNDFTDDAGLFKDLLADFMAFSEEERRRNDLLEQRTRDAEEGRARALQARLGVQHELNQRLQGRTLPKAVVDMLLQGWSQVLLLAWLKHGDASQAWSQALQTMDTLLGSIEPHREPCSQARLLAQVPDLLKALRDGLAGIAMDSVATRDFFLQLEKLHMRALAGHDLAGEARDDALTPVPVLDQVVLALPEENACGPLLDLDDQASTLDALERLRVGTWVELVEDGEIRRCKLIARDDDAQRFVFVNRSGIDVRRWNQCGLIMALRHGELRLLDDGPVFDRALQSVLDRLRRQQAH